MKEESLSSESKINIFKSPQHPRIRLTKTLITKDNLKTADKLVSLKRPFSKIISTPKINTKFKDNIKFMKLDTGFNIQKRKSVCNLSLCSSFREKNKNFNNNEKILFNFDNNEDDKELFPISEDDNEFEKKTINKLKINKNQIFKSNERKQKSNYVLTMSVIYYSIFLLSAKIISIAKLPEIPSTSSILFVFYFNELILSLIFIKIDQIDIIKNISIKDLNYFIIEILLEYIKSFFTISSLKRIPLLPFIVILYLNPILTSHTIIKQRMGTNTKIDKIFYLITALIIIYEFLTFNKLGTIYSTMVLLVVSFGSTRKFKNSAYFHAYYVIFGSGIIGVSFSPLIMSIDGYMFYISSYQFLSIFILCIGHFFYLYFLQKYARSKDNSDKRILFNTILPITLLYSIFIFNDRFNFSFYFIVILSFCSHVYGRMKLDTMENE